MDWLKEEIYVDIKTEVAFKNQNFACKYRKEINK